MKYPLGQVNSTHDALPTGCFASLCMTAATGARYLAPHFPPPSASSPAPPCCKRPTEIIFDTVPTTSPTWQRTQK